MSSRPAAVEPGRSPDSSADPGRRALTLSDLEGQPSEVLKDQGPGAARVVRYDLKQGSVILKTWLDGGSRILGFYGKSLLKREIRHYQQLDGCRGIPRFLGQVGRFGLILEYVDGLPVHRKLEERRLMSGLDDLERVLAELHSRRFAHLDLHQKLNVLIDPAGRAWLIDLGQGVDCRGLLGRLVFPLLARIDRAAVLKFRARYAPATFPEDDRERLVDRHGTRRSWWPKRIGRWARRRLLGDD